MLAGMTRLVTGLNFRYMRLRVEQMKVAAIVLLRGLGTLSKVATSAVLTTWKGKYGKMAVENIAH